MRAVLNSFIDCLQEGLYCDNPRLDNEGRFKDG
jgi:hypothetical protein